MSLSLSLSFWSCINALGRNKTSEQRCYNFVISAFIKNIHSWKDIFCKQNINMKCSTLTHMSDEKREYLRGPVHGPSREVSHCPHDGLYTSVLVAHGLHQGPSGEQWRKNHPLAVYMCRMCFSPALKSHSDCDVRPRYKEIIYGICCS